jgi:phage terminase small subunit
MSEAIARAPGYLSASARRWFAAVATTYHLEPHHVRLLTLCCQSWDRAEQARQVLAKEGLTYLDARGNPHGRPEVVIARDATALFGKLLRQLELADDELPQPQYDNSTVTAIHKGSEHLQE